MDDPAGVRVRERRRDRHRDLDDLRPGEAALARDLGEVRALDELHHEERRLAVLAVVVEADDVLVLERGQNARLTRESPSQLLVLGDPRVQELDRDIAPETAVARPPDRAHAALADARTQLVPAGDQLVHRLRAEGARIS